MSKWYEIGLDEEETLDASIILPLKPKPNSAQTNHAQKTQNTDKYG